MLRRCYNNVLETVSIDYIGSMLVNIRRNAQNLLKTKTSKTEGLICNEEDHSGSDYTSRSVARNQVPGRKN